MLNDLFDSANRRVCDACETARRLDGLITRTANDGIDRPAQTLSRLADTFGRREAGIAGDVQASNDLLTRARSILGSDAVGADVARAARTIGPIAANINRIAGIADKISSGAASLAGGDITSAMGAVGSTLSASVSSIKGTFGKVQQAFTARVNPPSLMPANIELTSLSPVDLKSGFTSALPSASSSTSHLLILTTSMGQSFYFNLSTAAFDTLKRQTSYNIASQDRLTRRPALQAVSKGSESITVSGAIFTRKAGAGQLDKLRRIGFAMQPLVLTTGYGEALGQWYLSRIDEEQEALFADGMPRKQTFTLEFQRYGEDYSDI